MELLTEPISQESQGIGHISDQARGAIKQATMGAAMQRLTVQRQSAYLDLKHSGRLKPATVLNFNPIGLKVHDGHVPWRIPSMMESTKTIKATYAGRTYEASYFTVREPSFVPWIEDVKKPATDDENASGIYKAVFILPIELLNQYRIEYTNPSRNLTGGVLVIEGDVHSFTKSKGTIRIPKTARLPDGTLSYFSEEVELQKELAATLDMQKDRCTFLIQQGDEYNQSEQDRKNITEVHRKWYRFAIKMGWKTKESSWMSATMEPEDTCKGCGKGIGPTDAFFCTCGRPFNPFSAFMAGEDVPESYLFALTGTELDRALAEMKRRADIRAKLLGATAPPNA